MSPADAVDVTEGLVEQAEVLYAGSPDAFTATRDAAAKEATRAGDKPLAAALRKLKRPSAAAWAVNLLVRRDAGRIEDVLALAESLRAAAQALDGEELRTLTRQRRQLTAALTSTARGLARDEGVRLSAAVLDQVEGVLTAAMLDPVAAQVVRTGRLVTAFTSTGVSELDPSGVVAVPQALDVVAVAADPVDRGSPGPSLTVVPDDTARRAELTEALEEARARVAAAQEQLAEVEESVETLRARRLQLQAEAEELRHRLAELESEVDDVDDELEEADAARAEAREELDGVREEESRAAQELDRLG